MVTFFFEVRCHLCDRSLPGVWKAEASSGGFLVGFLSWWPKKYTACNIIVEEVPMIGGPLMGIERCILLKIL
jgi:hypothetical protein